MKRRALLLTSLALPGFAFAQTTGQKTEHMTHGAASDSAASRAYAEANARMHEEMATPFSGDADIDFIRSMIAHHRGAVAMARIVIEHGSDPEVRALAENVIAAQEAEMIWMQDWLTRKGA